MHFPAINFLSVFLDHECTYHLNSFFLQYRGAIRLNGFIVVIFAFSIVNVKSIWINWTQSKLNRNTRTSDRFWTKPSAFQAVPTHVSTQSVIPISWFRTDQLIMKSLNFWIVPPVDFFTNEQCFLSIW